MRHGRAQAVGRLRRTTVVLAPVLFLLAQSQRFKLRRVRLGLLVPAGGLMTYALVTILRFPRL